jgi:endonuclease III/AraC-like DNA-binding protein
MLDRFDRDEDPDLEALEALAERVRREPATFPDVAALVAASGLGVARLQRLFLRHFHATPAAFLERARGDAARRALLAGRERGLRDSRRILDVTGLFPDDYRKLGRTREFVLDLPAGYLAGPTLAYLGRDPRSPSERAWPAGFAKTLLLAGRPVLVRVEIEVGRRGGAARCRVEQPRGGSPLPPEVMGEAHEAALRLLGLAGSGEPAGFLRRIAARDGLRRLAAGREGLRIPLAADPFEGLAWAIVGQQVNLAFAASLRRTVTELAGEPAGDGWIAPPSPAAVARLDPADLARRQFSRRKAEYLVGAARAVASGELPLATLGEGSATRAERRLLALRGIGPWTAQYVMLRSLGFADCLPVGDAGLAAALTRFFALASRPGPAETRELMEPFAPHRSLATAHLWASLGDAP